MIGDGAHVPLCPVCSEGLLEPVIALEGVPVHVGALWPTRAAAVGCPRGDLRLGRCRVCGFVHNVAFDPGLADYTEPYDNALHFSEVFQGYERALAERLIERYGLRDADILEIGCGTGHFLGLICEMGGSRGLGFDPSHDPAHADPLLAGRARVIPEYFSEEHASHAADLVCCRQVLEHVPRPDAFMRAIRAGIGDRDTPVYVEVPNGLMPLRRLSVGDLIYEHCSYFVESSLRRLFAETGFEVLDLYEAYDGQFLGVEARPATGVQVSRRDEAEERRVAEEVAAFPARFAERASGWREMLEELREAGATTVAWGAGARAVGFFNLLGIGEEIDRVVDLNPRKQGTFLTGTGQRIVPAQDLVSSPADTVLIMNPLYAEEIGATLRHLGVPARVLPV